MNPRLLILIPLLFLGACVHLPPKQDAPSQPILRIYAPKPWFVEEGIASWYGGRWIGRLTANGERYRAKDMTAAHKKLPFHTKVRVIDLKTGRSVIVRINNRGPFKKGRIIDLSAEAARALGTYERGLARVRIEALKEIPQMTRPNLSTKRLARHPGQATDKLPEVAPAKQSPKKSRSSGGEQRKVPPSHKASASKSGSQAGASHPKVRK